MIPITIVFVGFVNQHSHHIWGPHIVSKIGRQVAYFQWAIWGTFSLSRGIQMRRFWMIRSWKTHQHYLIFPGIGIATVNLPENPICFMDETACVSMVFPSKPPFLGCFFRMYFPIARQRKTSHWALKCRRPRCEAAACVPAVSIS